MTLPRGPHPLPPEPEPNEEQGLSRFEEHGSDPRVEDPRGSATFHAMAEALRANAAALHKIDTSQRQMADSMQKSDRVTQVVTSTQALNETFRGLSEIQRGLLDALVRERNRAVGAGPWPYLALTLLLALLGVLAWALLSEDSRVSREIYERARRQADEMTGQVASLEAHGADLKERLAKTERSEAALREKGKKDAVELSRAKEELSRNKAQVTEYLKIKDRADAAGAVMIANDQLQREVADLRRQRDRLRTENERLWKKLADGTMEGKLGDPEKIIDQAKKLKVIPDADADKPAPNFSTKQITFIRRRLKRLFEGARADQGYELLRFKGMDGPDGLLDVEVGRYEKHQTVASIQAKRLELRLDAAGDSVELRFVDGYMVNLSRPAEKIPLDPEGHSVFLKGTGVKGWLEWMGDAVELGPQGQLIWK
ncbi:MAG: hypothetical protein ACYTGZ_05725 [Planctomycetota bacterium]|jgi:hypothetical protein